VPPLHTHVTVAASPPLHSWTLIHDSLPQNRFRNPLWEDVDRLAEYLQEAFETVMTMRANVPAEEHAVASRDMSLYTALLVIFSAACAFVYVGLALKQLAERVRFVCRHSTARSCNARKACACGPAFPLSRYFPMYTWQLNSSVKGNRALLLLLPIDVVESVKVGTGVGPRAGHPHALCCTRSLECIRSPGQSLCVRFMWFQVLKETMTTLTKQVL
jgi:hypothetical protein